MRRPPRRSAVPVRHRCTGSGRRSSSSSSACAVSPAARRGSARPPPTRDFAQVSIVVLSRDRVGRPSVRAFLHQVDVVDANGIHLYPGLCKLWKQVGIVQCTRGRFPGFVGFLEDHQSWIVLPSPYAVRLDLGAERHLEDAVVLDLPYVVVGDSVVDHDGGHSQPPSAIGAAILAPKVLRIRRSVRRTRVRSPRATHAHTYRSSSTRSRGPRTPPPAGSGCHE